MKKWYAVVRDKLDNDLGTGSTRLREAAKMVRDYRKNWSPDAYIVVVDVTNKDSAYHLPLYEIHDVKGL